MKNLRTKKYYRIEVFSICTDEIQGIGHYFPEELEYLGLPVPSDEILDDSKYFYFTEKGWKKIGKKIYRLARTEELDVRVSVSFIRQRLVKKVDDLQVMI